MCVRSWYSCVGTRTYARNASQKKSSIPVDNGHMDRIRASKIVIYTMVPTVYV